MFPLKKNNFGDGIADGVNSAEIIKIDCKTKAKRTNQIHVVLKSFSKIPEGQPGAGNTPWLFIDEIEIR